MRWTFQPMVRFLLMGMVALTVLPGCFEEETCYQLDTLTGNEEPGKKGTITIRATSSEQDNRLMPPLLGASYTAAEAKAYWIQVVGAIGADAIEVKTWCVPKDKTTGTDSDIRIRESPIIVGGQLVRGSSWMTTPIAPTTNPTAAPADSFRVRARVSNDGRDVTLALVAADNSEQNLPITVKRLFKRSYQAYIELEPNNPSGVRAVWIAETRDERVKRVSYTKDDPAAAVFWHPAKMVRE